MLFHIVCGLLLLNIFAAETATPRSKSTGLLGLEKLLAAAKTKISKITSPEEKLSPTECYDQAPKGCRRLYEEDVCNHKEVAMEYCPVTCGFCIPKKRVSRPAE